MDYESFVFNRLERRDGDYIASDVAREIVDGILNGKGRDRLTNAFAELTEEQRMLMDELLGRAADWTTILIGRLRRHSRAAISFTEQRAEATAETFGMSQAGRMRLATLDVPFVVDDDKTERRLGDLTRADCQFIAGGYSARSFSAARRVRLFEHLGTKVTRGRRLRDCMSETQVEDTFRRFLGSDE